MISRVQFDAYNQATENIASQAAGFVEQQINAWVAANPDAKVSEIRNAAKEIMNAAVPIYNDGIAELGSQLWDEAAREAGTELDRAITTHVFSEDEVKKVCHYQARKLIDADYLGFAKACGEFASNNAMKALNETMLANAARDRERAQFARVPTGKDTCAFCLMLATRGAVYWSRQSAGEFSHYHRNCDCKVVPSYEGQYGEYVEGFSAIELNNRLVEIANFYGIGDPYKHIDEMNKVLPLYSPEHLVFGEKPEVGYESEAAEAFKAKDKDHQSERRTAEALASYGFDVRFAKDVIENEKGANVGLPDLASGLEIKTLQSSASENTINGYLKNTSKKRNAIAVVFDNQLNEGFSDAELVSILLRKQSFRNGIVLVIGHDGEPFFVR